MPKFEYKPTILISWLVEKKNTYLTMQLVSMGTYRLTLIMYINYLSAFDTNTQMHWLHRHSEKNCLWLLQSLDQSQIVPICLKKGRTLLHDNHPLYGYTSTPLVLSIIIIFLLFLIWYKVHTVMHLTIVDIKWEVLTYYSSFSHSLFTHKMFGYF